LCDAAEFVFVSDNRY